MPSKQTFSTIPERLRGGIAFALMLASIIGAVKTTSNQWQVTFITAFLLYMVTAISFVRDKGVSHGQEES